MLYRASLILFLFLFSCSLIKQADKHPEYDLLEFKKELTQESIIIIDSLIQDNKHLKELLDECQESKTIKPRAKSF